MSGIKYSPRIEVNGREVRYIEVPGGIVRIEVWPLSGVSLVSIARTAETNGFEIHPTATGMETWIREGKVFSTSEKEAMERRASLTVAPKEGTSE